MPFMGLFQALLLEKGRKGQFQTAKPYKELFTRQNRHCNIAFEVITHKKCIVSNELPSNKAYLVVLGLFKPITSIQAVSIKNVKF